MEDVDIKKANETDALMGQIFPAPLEKPKNKGGRPKRVRHNSTEGVAPREGSPTPVLSDAVLWEKAMLCIMQNYQVRSPSDVSKCVPAADEFVRLYKEKWGN